MNDLPSTERWKQISEALDAVLDAPPDERAARLQDVCAGDAALRREVETFLYIDAPAFLEAGAAACASPLLTTSSDEAREEAASSQGLLEAGDRVGPYRVVEQIGQGGMSTIYRAERVEGPFERSVALKVLRRTVAVGSDARRRFQAERQILASLQHPHIAQVFGGGVTAEGRPYLAMEFVEGRTLTTYCTEEQCTTDERLTLFDDVAAAVQHAHRRLVVHRDLKPSNVLVTAEGQVKLLDFGIAKLLAGRAAPEEPRTRTSTLLMTPAYAAPEQVQGGEVTTATDGYALGVLLYELLAGRRPYEVNERAPVEIARVVCEEEPPRPSRAAADDERRSALRGDLDAIVMKALRKEPDRRYASVEALRNDLDRHRRGLPVAARRGTWRYRVGKFARRHQTGTIAAVLVVLLVAVFFGVLAWQQAQTARQRDRAQAEAQKAEQVSQFLMGLFEAQAPGTAQGEPLSADQLLKRGVERSEALKEQPAVQAQMLNVIGEIYQLRGKLDQSGPLVKRSLELRRRLHPEGHPEIAESLSSLATQHWQQGRYEKADSLYRRVLVIRRRTLGEEHNKVAATMTDLALIHRIQGRHEAADSLYRRALALERRIYEGDHRSVASILASLAVNERKRGNYEEARRLQRKALAMRKRLFETPHPEVAGSLHNLAQVADEQGRYETADSLYREALAMERALYDGPHPMMAQTLNNIGMLYGPRGQHEKAASFLRRALAMRKKLYPDDHPDVAESLNNLAMLSTVRGDYEKARPLMKEVLAVDRARYGEEHPYVGGDLHNLGRIAKGRGELEEAEARFRQALQVYKKRLPSDHRRIAASLSSLGEVRLQRGAVTDADSLLRRALRIRRQVLPEGHWRRAQTQSAMGACRTQQEQYARAESLLKSAYVTLKEERGLGDRHTKKALRRLVRLYDAWGKPEKAAPYRETLAATG